MPHTKYHPHNIRPICKYLNSFLEFVDDDDVDIYFYVRNQFDDVYIGCIEHTTVRVPLFGLCR